MFHFNLWIFIMQNLFFTIILNYLIINYLIYFTKYFDFILLIHLVIFIKIQ
jgi:hypothetical protein